MVDQPGAFSDAARDTGIVFRMTLLVIDNGNTHHPIHAGDGTCREFVVNRRPVPNESKSVASLYKFSQFGGMVRS